MSYKKLIPCIFIDSGKAVKWFDDRTVLSEDVVGLAKYYSDHGADELIVLDLRSRLWRSLDTVSVVRAVPSLVMEEQYLRAI